jgi:hypothetical protein
MEIHDNELDSPKGTLVADIGNIDYGYQAEQWVIDTYQDHDNTVLWLLFLGDKPEKRSREGVEMRFLTRVWERKPGDTGMPEELTLIENWERRVNYPKDEPTKVRKT